MCNGGDETAELREALSICPTEGCTETQSCSEELMRDWAQGVCGFSCGVFGLTVYPDLNRTEVYNTANVNCPNAFFDAPTLAEPDVCQVKGSLPQTIELLEVTTGKDPEPEDVTTSKDPEPEDSSSGSNSSWNSFAAFLLFGVFYA